MIKIFGRHNAQHHEVEALSGRLENLQDLGLSPEARARIWHSALQKAEAGEVVTRSAPLRFYWPVYSAFSFLFMFILVLSSVRVAFVAQSSLPGDSLYQLKRAMESVWLVAQSPEEQPRARLTLLDRRILEVGSLLDASQPVPEETFYELTSTFRIMGEYPTLWEAEDEDLTRYLDEQGEALFTMALEHREVYGLREVFRASFHAQEQLDQAAAHPQVLLDVRALP